MRTTLFKNQGITEDQMRKQYAANAKSLRWMEGKAKEKGKYNGYTPDELSLQAERYETLSKTFKH